MPDRMGFDQFYVVFHLPVRDLGDGYFFCVAGLDDLVYIRDVLQQLHCFLVEDLCR